MMSDAELRALLQEARTIAVVGLSPNPLRPSHTVSRYMQRSGYTIIPVNPGHSAIIGEKSYRTLSEAVREHSIDIVDVFRRAELVGPIVDEAIAIKPKLIWLQLGVVDHAAEQRAAAAGVPFIMDLCLATEHERLRD